jgi:hypothetical protein
MRWSIWSAGNPVSIEARRETVTGTSACSDGIRISFYHFSPSIDNYFDGIDSPSDGESSPNPELCYPNGSRATPTGLRISSLDFDQGEWFPATVKKHDGRLQPLVLPTFYRVTHRDNTDLFNRRTVYIYAILCIFSFTC